MADTNTRFADPTSDQGASAHLETMWTIRAFEQGLEELFQRGLLHGTMHLSIGQEAVAAGVCGALADGDLITSTHRGHGHCLAHGADPERMMAELLAKDSGYCKGRGGSMHIADVSRGNLGANGIVAGSMTIAAGAALAQRQQGSDAIVVCFFGDGAANEGAFHEALNLAGIWSLPVVYVCENNQYGMSMSTARATAGNDIAGRADAYGLPGTRVDGNDILAVRTATLEAAGRARSGKGASLIEAVTYRYRGHSKSDRNLYRTRDEITEWRDERDPIDAFASWCKAQGVLTDDQIAQACDQGKDTIKRAVAGAMKGPEPDPADLVGSAYAADLTVASSRGAA